MTTTRTRCALRTRWIHGASGCALVVAHAALGVGTIFPTLVTARCVVEEAPIHDDTGDLLHLHDVNRRFVRGSADRLIDRPLIISLVKEPTVPFGALGRLAPCAHTIGSVVRTVTTRRLGATKAAYTATVRFVDMKLAAGRDPQHYGHIPHTNWETGYDHSVFRSHINLLSTELLLHPRPATSDLDH